MRLTLPVPVFVAMILFVASANRQAFADCGLTVTGKVPLPDLVGTYQGFPGGLYPAGRPNAPHEHAQAGLDRAVQIRPLDTTGAIDTATGKIVLLSLGMSNTTQQFSEFMQRAQSDPAKNPRLIIVDGARGGQASDAWQNPDHENWKVFQASRLAAAGVTPKQVQVAWVKQAQMGAGPFPNKALALQADLEVIANNLKLNYPNIRIAYFSSRTRSYAESGLSPEPTAYETAFSVKWMIGKQIEGGLPGAPWLSWGPYLWTDGLLPRSDGFTWACTDLNSDFTHPSPTGRIKVADQLQAFFKTAPTATPWYLRPAQGAPVVQVTPASASVAAGDTLRFSATAQDPDGIREFIWTFDDGTFAFGPKPVKVFRLPGLLNVRLTVVDSQGNAATTTVPVQVGSPVSTLPDTRLQVGYPRSYRGRALGSFIPFAEGRDALGRRL